MKRRELLKAGVAVLSTLRVSDAAPPDPTPEQPALPPMAIEVVNSKGKAGTERLPVVFTRTVEGLCNTHRIIFTPSEYHFVATGFQLYLQGELWRTGKCDSRKAICPGDTISFQPGTLTISLD